MQERALVTLGLSPKQNNVVNFLLLVQMSEMTLKAKHVDLQHFGADLLTLFGILYRICRRHLMIILITVPVIHRTVLRH